MSKNNDKQGNSKEELPKNHIQKTSAQKLLELTFNKDNI